ncbi:MAG: hypothetical protein RR295_07100, partial [Oscillospiraceae bacterium]
MAADFSSGHRQKTLQYVSIPAIFWLASQKICSPICTTGFNQRFLKKITAPVRAAYFSSNTYRQ